MNRGDLRTISRALVPGAKINTISNLRVNLIMEAGILDIAIYSKCLPTSKKFTVTADQDEYSLTSVIGDFLTMEKSGLWHNVGSASSVDWQEVLPRTLKRLDRKRSGWRNEGSDSPYEYDISGDILKLIPPPETTLASGLWLYYASAPIIMSSDSQYPFTGVSENTHLKVFDEAIVMYLQYKLSQVVAKGKGVSGGITEKDYMRVRAERIALFNRRPDISSHRSTKFQGKKFKV